MLKAHHPFIEVSVSGLGNFGLFSLVGSSMCITGALKPGTAELLQRSLLPAPLKTFHARAPRPQTLNLCRTIFKLGL